MFRETVIVKSHLSVLGYTLDDTSTSRGYWERDDDWSIDLVK